MCLPSIIDTLSPLTNEFIFEAFPRASELSYLSIVLFLFLRDFKRLQKVKIHETFSLKKNNVNV